MDRLAKILVSAKVGEKVDFEGINIKLSISKNGCEGCVFETEEKAEGCTFKSACMAHLRKDRESVVFANGTMK